jgi:short-subunit dehydrogenase
MSACAKSYINREPRSAQGNRLILGDDLRGTKSPLVSSSLSHKRASSPRFAVGPAADTPPRKLSSCTLAAVGGPADGWRAAASASTASVSVRFLGFVIGVFAADAHARQKGAHAACPPPIMGAMQLTDAVVLVTGASAGIGHAAATRFAARGARVLVHGRDPDRTGDIARKVGGTALFADLGTPADRHRLAAEALDAFGRVDILVNNAGFGYSGPLTAMSVDTIRRLVEVNLVAAMELTRALLPGMVERKHGAICFVTSVAGRTGVAGEAVYSATKAGVDAFAESLRAETAGSRVNVGVVVPGVVDTGFFDTRGRPYQRTRPRPISPDAVADAVVRTVISGRAEAWVPRWLRIAPTVRALAPGAYRRLAVRFGERVRSG